MLGRIKRIARMGLSKYIASDRQYRREQREWREQRQKLREENRGYVMEAIVKMDRIRRPRIFEVNGEQVFNAQWIGEQMMYSCSGEDRTRTQVKIAIVVSIIAIIASAVAIYMSLA